jgi:23S rRNA (uracil1939-C5)-methyltransferase
MTRCCRHFGECGGCQSQDLPYAEQLARKEAEIRRLFAPFWQGDVPVEPSPEVWHYRNKVDPTFARKQYDAPPPPGFERESVLGFKRKGRWYWPLDIQECLIGPERLPELLDVMRGWMRAQGLQVFDSRTKEGFLRTLLVREGKRTGQHMVVLTTSPGTFDKVAFVEAVRAVFPDASVHHGISEGLADVAFAEEMELLDGPPAIEEQLHIPDETGPRELRFMISPFSFFQTNTLATERLYGAIRRWVRETAPEVLYDLYSGMGGIALSCADLVRRVLAVEGVYSATDDGGRNAALNGIENVTFYTENVKNFLLGLLTEGGMPPGSAAVVDPSRAGMHPKALRRLIDLMPANILYVSCNPKVLVQELPQFLEAYRLKDLRAFDLFPHTRHVEVMARLALKMGRTPA